MSPPAGQPDREQVRHALRRLHAAYPAFQFSYSVLSPWKGMRWHAERINRAGGGLLVVITGDLMELHAALQRDKARHGR